MSNELTTTHGGDLSAFDKGFNPFAAAAAEMGVISGNFLKFDGNSGDYTYGPEKDQKELSHGDQLAINMTTFKRGWICWKEEKVVEEVMVPILEGSPPSEGALTDHGPYAEYADGTKDGWLEQASVEAHTLEGGDKLIWKATSKSARRALGSLVAEFGKLFRSKPGQIPVIEIGAAQFEAKVGPKEGPQRKIKKYAPTLKIVGWIPNAEFEELVEQGNAAGASASSTTSEAGDEDDAANYTDAADVPTVDAKAPTTVAPAEAAPSTGRRAKRF